MGLRQGDASHPRNQLLSVWMLPIVALGIITVLALLGDGGRTWLALDREAIGAGEFWRLISGHFVHLGVSHVLLNLAGLVLVWYLIGEYFSIGEWLAMTFAIIIGIDLGLWLFEPQLQWYVGLSGVLHGALAAGIVGGLRTRRIDVFILAIALVAKLAYEQLVGPLPGSEQSSGGNVIVDAHAYGALTGAVTAVILIRVRRRPSI